MCRDEHIGGKVHWGVKIARGTKVLYFDVGDSFCEDFCFIYFLYVCNFIIKLFQVTSLYN